MQRTGAKVAVVGYFNVATQKIAGYMEGDTSCMIPYAASTISSTLGLLK
jgi:hypothetical protein